jgi:hypothetical protein
VDVAGGLAGIGPKLLEPTTGRVTAPLVDGAHPDAVLVAAVRSVGSDDALDLLDPIPVSSDLGLTEELGRHVERYGQLAPSGLLAELLVSDGLVVRLLEEGIAEGVVGGLDGQDLVGRGGVDESRVDGDQGLHDLYFDVIGHQSPVQTYPRVGGE